VFTLNEPDEDFFECAEDQNSEEEEVKTPEPDAESQVSILVHQFPPQYCVIKPTWGRLLVKKIATENQIRAILMDNYPRKFLKSSTESVFPSTLG
jgi:hypothetical protein